MKSSITRIAVVALVATLGCVSAFAKSKQKTVEFPKDIKVNGTTINKGTYAIKFDEETNELSIVDGKKVLARAAATLAKRDRKASRFMLHSTGSGNELQLTGITFAGADQDVVVSGSQASR